MSYQTYNQKDSRRRGWPRLSRRGPRARLPPGAGRIAEKAAALAKETGCQPFHDYDERLRAGIDVISICLPPAPHLAAAEAAARAGVHVLMEKPIARTVAEADQMVAACRAAGV